MDDVIVQHESRYMLPCRQVVERIEPLEFEPITRASKGKDFLYRIIPSEDD